MIRLLVLGDGRIAPTLSALSFAQEWAARTGGAFSLLVPGDDAPKFVRYGTARIFTYSVPAQAESVAFVCQSLMAQAGTDCLAGVSNAFGRDCLPRAAGLLNVPMVSDLMRLTVEGGDFLCERPAHSGRWTETVRVSGPCVFSVRAASFGPPRRAESVSPVEAFTENVPPARSIVVLEDFAEHRRPALENARVVVAGGRPLRDTDSWERLIEGLADALRGAVGATGGAVGAGLADNDALIGQTGKTIAPELYIGAGVSGSDQHVAGMRDSRVIVAINSDPQATLFRFADYGIVADVHDALPELIAKVKEGPPNPPSLGRASVPLDRVAAARRKRHGETHPT